MFIEQALKEQLLMTAPVKALVGDKIFYVGNIPQDVSTPYIALQKISDVHGKVFSGPNRLQIARIQITIIDTSWLNCKNIADAIQTGIDGFTGTMGSGNGVEVGLCSHDNDNDLPPETELKLYGVAADYILNYTR